MDKPTIGKVTLLEDADKRVNRLQIEKNIRYFGAIAQSNGIKELARR